MLEKTCRHCGKAKDVGLFPSNPRLRDGIDSWCRACHSDAVKRSPSQVLKRRGPVTVACTQCGASFTSTAANAKYCSVRCSRDAVSYQPRPKRTVSCRTCGRCFIQPRADSEYCSRRCQPNTLRHRQQKAIRNREAKVRRLAQRVCLFCGKRAIERDGTLAWSGRRTIFCSSLCGREYHRWSREERMRGAIIEPVDIAVLLERDGGICQLCRKPVGKGRRRFAANYPTIDHIVPISRGGEHSYRNTQLAHRRCNIRKSAGPAQLNWINQVPGAGMAA